MPDIFDTITESGDVFDTVETDIFDAVAEPAGLSQADIAAGQTPTGIQSVPLQEDILPPPSPSRSIDSSIIHRIGRQAIKAFAPPPTVRTADVFATDIQFTRMKQRKEQGGRRFSEELLAGEFEDIKRELALRPEAREADDLRAIPDVITEEPLGSKIETPQRDAEGILTPRGRVEAGSDIAVGVASFITKTVLLKKAFGGAPAVARWEARNLAEGGPVGKGAGVRAGLGVIETIPTLTAIGKGAKIAAGGGFFGTLTALEGGDFVDVTVSTIIGAGYQAWGIKKQNDFVKSYKAGLRKQAFNEVTAKTQSMRSEADRLLRDELRAATTRTEKIAARTRHRQLIRGISSLIERETRSADKLINAQMDKVNSSIRQVSEAKAKKAREVSQKEPELAKTGFKDPAQRLTTPKFVRQQQKETARTVKTFAKAKAAKTPEKAFKVFKKGLPEATDKQINAAMESIGISPPKPVIKPVTPAIEAVTPAEGAVATPQPSKQAVEAKLPTTEPTVIEPTPTPVQKTEFIGDQPEPNVAKEVQQSLPQQAKIAPIKLTSESKDTSTLLDTFFAERDIKETAVDVTTQQHQAELTRVSGAKKAGAVTEKWDEAIQVYIDLQDNPDQLKYYEKLTPKQKKVVDTAQSLPPNIKAFADKLIAENREFGKVAVDEEVIRNFKENYTARLWEADPKAQQAGLTKKFGTTTARAKGRTLEGILHGWSLGKTLRIKGATSAQNVAHKQVTQAIVDKQVMKMAKDWGLISPQRHEGWIQVEHPNFTNWKFAGQVVAGKVYGRNFFKTNDGMLLERVPMYAEPELAKKLNTALSSSKLRGIGIIDFLSKWNAIIKQNVLMTSFFHHQAFLRSYMAGGKTGLKNLNPKQAYKAGGEAIRNFAPEVQQLVRGGLTIGKIQDWDEADLQRENTVFSRVARKFKVGEKGLDVVERIRKQQTDFLFKKMGPQLKVQAALLEYRHQLKKNNAKLERGEVSQHDIAKNVADLINDDFGGLNLRRIGRNQTLQHLFRLIALAPDWTESNVRSMVKAFRRGDEGAMYRAFWGRIALKMGIATAAFNFLMAAFDDDDFVERYQKAWKEGKMRWLDIDVTPIYRGLGGGPDKRKYFSLIGHFRDPLKFILHPIRSAKHKGSVLSRILFDAFTGQDWAGRSFTDFDELTGIGKKHGFYQTGKKGRLKGKLVKFSVGGGEPLEFQQIPSFIFFELRAAQPIQVQNALAFLAGEMDAFDALTKSAGIQTSTTRPKRK